MKQNEDPQQITPIDLNGVIDNQARHAEEIFVSQACPHCNAKLNRFEILSLARGTAVPQSFVAMLRDGRLVRAGDDCFNPRVMWMVAPDSAIHRGQLDNGNHD